MNPPESDESRAHKAERLAYEKGLKDAKNTAHFVDLNGSVDRLESTVERMCNRLIAMEKREQSRDDIAKATKAAVEEHGKAQVSGRQFAFGAVGMVAAVGGLFVAAAPPG